jgi:hypothetical protein
MLASRSSWHAVEAAANAGALPIDMLPKAGGPTGEGAMTEYDWSAFAVLPGELKLCIGK